MRKTGPSSHGRGGGSAHPQILPGRVGRSGLVDNLKDGPAQQIETADEVEPVSHFRPFGLRQKPLKDAAGVYQGNQHHIAGVRDVIVEQHAHDARFHFPLRLAIDHWIPAGSSHPSGQRERAIALPFQNAESHQAFDRLVANGVGRGRLREPLHPVAAARGRLR